MEIGIVGLDFEKTVIVFEYLTGGRGDPLGFQKSGKMQEGTWKFVDDHLRSLAKADGGEIAGVPIHIHLFSPLGEDDQTDREIVRELNRLNAVLITETDDDYKLVDSVLSESGLAKDKPRLAVLVDELGDVAQSRENLFSELRRGLQLIRVYTTARGKCQLWLAAEDTRVIDFAGTVHTDLAAGFTSAKIRRLGEPGSKTVGKDYVLHDGDVVEILSGQRKK